MNEQVYSISEIRNILLPVFKYHNVRKAVLFGSYAKGNARYNSDIDLLVDSGLKAIPHKDCAADTQSDFSAECIKIPQAYWRMSRDFCVL